MTDVYKKVDLARLMELAGQPGYDEVGRPGGGKGYAEPSKLPYVPTPPTGKDSIPGLQGIKGGFVPGLLDRSGPVVTTPAPARPAIPATPARPAAPLNPNYKGSEGAREIQRLNPEIKDVNKIRPGQEFKLPDGSTYKVQPGDTLDAIARNQGKGADAVTPRTPAPAAPAAPAAPGAGIALPGQLSQVPLRPIPPIPAKPFMGGQPGYDEVGRPGGGKGSAVPSVGEPRVSGVLNMQPGMLPLPNRSGTDKPPMPPAIFPNRAVQADVRKAEPAEPAAPQATAAPFTPFTSVYNPPATTPAADAAKVADVANVAETQSGLDRLAELAGIKKKVNEADADWSARPVEAPRVSIDDILSGRAKPELATSLPGGPPAPAAIAQPLEPRGQEPAAEISPVDRARLSTAVVQPTSQAATTTDVKPATVSSFGTTDTGRATRIDPRAKYLRPEAERLAREKELEPLARELVPAILTAPIGGAVTGAVAKPVIGAIGRQLAKRAGSEIAKDVGVAAGREAGRDIARAAPRTDYMDPAKKIRDIERARPGQPAPQPSGTAPSSAAPRPTGEPPASIHDKPVDLEKAAELVAQAEKAAAQKATTTAIPQPAVAPRGAEQLAKRMEVGQERLGGLTNIVKATGEKPSYKAAGAAATAAAATGIPYVGYQVYNKMQEPEAKAELERRRQEIQKMERERARAQEQQRQKELAKESLDNLLSQRVQLLKTQLAEYKLQEAKPELRDIPPHREYTPSPEVETASARRYAKQKLIQMGVTDPKKLDAAMKKWEKGVRAAQKKQP